jgi:hypothetical protein
MAIDSLTPRSRRALLMGTAGAVTALAAQALGRPLRVEAANTSISYTNDEDNGTVISASSVSNGPGTGQGIGVDGHSDDSVGVRGTSDSNVGVRGDSKSSYGVWAESQSYHALAAFSGPGIGVWGTSGSSVGVRGESEHGRGGLFKGRKAQLRLQPSTSNSHPASGAVGDLFVDKHGRLWFCKGGSRWKQLA